MLPGMDDLMPIGDFSARTGLSPRRLRSYAADGLLIPAAVDATTGYRYYSPGQMHEAQVIDALRRAGVPLAEIAALLRQPSPEQLAAWERELLVEASDRKEALRVARRLLGIDAEPRADTAHESSGSQRRRDMMRTLHASGRTDIGRVREKNEDALLCTDELVAVADGLGGHPGGEVASSLAVTLLQAAFTGRSIDELEAAVRAANRAICEHAQANEELQGMATTLCAVGLTADRQLAVVNVGDSRAYLLRDGSLRQLTDDHTVTADLVRRGEVTEEQAVDHPYRSVLTRALGAGPTVDVDREVLAAAPGDRLLLCTDGLFNEVPDEEIASVLRSTDDLSADVDVLVDRALANGGRDNVTVVMVDIAP
jgi:PPM family protein phosphatase